MFLNGLTLPISSLSMSSSTSTEFWGRTVAGFVWSSSICKSLHTKSSHSPLYHIALQISKKSANKAILLISKSHLQRFFLTCCNWWFVVLFRSGYIHKFTGFRTCNCVRFSIGGLLSCWKMNTNLTTSNWNKKLYFVTIFFQKFLQ